MVFVNLVVLKKTALYRSFISFLQPQCKRLRKVESVDVQVSCLERFSVLGELKHCIFAEEMSRFANMSFWNCQPLYDIVKLESR